MLCKSNEQGIGARDVVSICPCWSDQRAQSHLAEVPSGETFDRDLCTVKGDLASDDVQVADACEHFRVEVFRDPEFAVRRNELGQSSSRSVEVTISTPAEASTMIGVVTFRASGACEEPRLRAAIRYVAHRDDR